MAYTGFGLATDSAGMSYVTMYAHDLQAGPGDWQYIAWPSAGAFPAELMGEDLAWSIILNPDLYDTDGAWVRLTDLGTGEAYEFPGDGGYFAVDAGGYGAGPCLVFRPELTKDYEQNQRWRVEAGTSSGPDIAFEVEMISLYPVEPSSVEMAPPRGGAAPRRDAAALPPPSSPSGRRPLHRLVERRRKRRHRGKRPRHRRGHGRMRDHRHIRQRKAGCLPPDRGGMKEGGFHARRTHHPACTGKCICAISGQTVTVVEVEGGQVADFFAEFAGDVREFLSPA